MAPKLEKKLDISIADNLKKLEITLTDGIRDQLKQKFPAFAEDIFDANWDLSTKVRVEKKKNGDVILLIGDKSMNVLSKDAEDLADLLMDLQKEKISYETEVTTVISKIKEELAAVKSGALTQLSIDGYSPSKTEANTKKDNGGGKADTTNNPVKETRNNNQPIDNTTKDNTKNINSDNDTTLPNATGGDWKRNEAEYQDMEAMGLDQLPKRARQAFRWAVQNNNLRMGDEVSTGTIYPNGKEGSDVDFRDLFSMVKGMNVAQAYSILKQGMDQQGNWLRWFASVDEKRGQFVLKSPAAVEKFWADKAKETDTGYNSVGSFWAHERNLLRKFTETFFKIANKGGKNSDNENLFMAALGISLTGDSLNKLDTSKRLLGTQKVATEITAKLADPNMKMDKAISAIVGNYNFDKKVDDKDINTITGKQMAAMYNDAKHQLYLTSKQTDVKIIKSDAETAMVQNMVDMLIYHIDTKSNGAGKVDWKTMNVRGRDAAVKELKDFKTEKQLLKKMSEVPSLVILYQDIFRIAGENASILFLKGKHGYEEVIERKADSDIQITVEKKPATGPIGSWARPYEQNETEANETESGNAPAISPEVNNLSPEIKNRVERHVSEAYDRAVQDLNLKVKDGKYADGTPIPESLRAQVEEAAANLFDASVAWPNKKLLTINALGALVNLVKGEEWLGLAANITSEKLNDLISNPESGWYNSINLVPGIYVAPNGKPIIGLMLGLQGKKTWTGKWGDHTFMYGLGVGAGLAKGRLVAWPAIDIGYEEQVNGRNVVKSISKKKANYIWGILAASLTEVGVGLYFRQDQYRAIEQQQQALESGLTGILQNAVKSAETLDAKWLTAALLKQYPKSSPADASKMAQNLSAMIKPYLLESKTKATLQQHLTAMSQGKEVNVDDVIAQVMADVSKLYALDWRNNQIMNMSKVQLTDFGIGKSISLKAADPIGSFVKSVLPIYAGVGITVFGKPRYQEISASKERAYDQINNARGIDADDRVAGKWSDKVPNLNAMVQDIMGEGTENNPTLTQYFTVSGNNVLIDPALLKVPGMNISILPTHVWYMGCENGKLVVPNSVIVMLHTLFEGKKMSYDFMIGTVGSADAIAVKSFDRFVDGHPEKIGDLGTAATAETVINSIEETTNDPDLKRIRDIASFTSLEKLGAEKNPAYKEYIGKILVNAKSGITLTGEKPVTINNIQYYVIEKPSHAQILFEQVPKKKNTYNFSVVNNETLPMSLQFKWFKESTAVIDLAKDMADKVPQKVKDFVNGPNINALLLKKEIHKHNGLKDQTVKAIQLASTTDTKADWEKAANTANKIVWTELFVRDATNPDALKDSLRYLNAKMAVTPAARDRDSSRYNTYKNDTTSDIIRSDNPAAQELLNTLYKDGKLAKEQNAELKKLLGKDKNILHSVDAILKARDGNMNNRLWKESYNRADITAFRDAWNKSIDQLGGRDTQVYSGTEMKGAIGMVFGYNADNTYDEKFVVQPKLATKPWSKNTLPDSYTAIDNPQIRAHFLDNLKNEEGGLLDRVLKPIVENEDACGKDCYKGDARKSAIEQFVKGMKEKGQATITLNGKTVTIKADFGHAFYNECFNETIVMNNIEVEVTPKIIVSDKTMDNQWGLYMNAINTVGQIDRNQKKFSVGILAWQPKPKKEKYESGTNTGEVDGSGTNTDEQVVIPWGTVDDIPGSDPVNTPWTTVPDIPTWSTVSTTTRESVMNASTVYPTIVGAEAFNWLAQNIKNNRGEQKNKDDKNLENEDKKTGAK